MAEITLKTKYFGQLNFPAEEGIVADLVVNFEGEELEISFDIFDKLVEEKNIATVQLLLDNAEAMYSKAKAYIKANYKTDEVIAEFIEWHIEELSEEFVDAYGTEEEVTAEEIIRQLRLTHLWLSPNEEVQGGVEITYDFTLQEVSDEILAVRFDKSLEITDVVWER
ncbi:Protein of unknown function [Capnocytophaga haemolytica]|uniref:DUF2004 domain-containing protein n=1 Tax=Capnocytophaga haemolytica TaxID=45243 RepID=A0AAX2GXK8_9FLAO|nr:DUF2004 domain-containing protein [Capnocytophaga haemolytica]AMD84568.1 hypothetical protein AXF12_02940 [Capnocytophaga haemolytica]SFN99482.1 Protein of unknown function [Capnocytophaga haemolytica]SNV09245.1 Uncharacterised protein [Capnocytophaga haemolytica]